ncbi:hypothetical protein [Crossiella cryophila]|uniref:Uncharacterized protein n=1 Tax=Crossiella cryophila TaxID=43355 RepID=A0A7W7CFH6_9PSEU|nr:hypothetical protein [Crossiella cryophila]MBB4678886.1 hypothetical protein [Crossiella cryophila]
MDNELWWSVWGFWAVIWLATAVALLIMLITLGLALRANRRPAAFPDLAFYLHEKSVMNLYLSGGYGDALRREVQEKVDTAKSRWFGLKLFRGGAGANHSAGREVVTRYIAQNQPIAVIGDVLRALESANGVVHVDLRRGTIRRSPALSNALTSLDPDHAPQQTPLRHLDRYVSIRGQFRLLNRTGAPATFQAAYGTPETTTIEATMRLDCHPDDLRYDQVPEGWFQARCLGKVQSWHPETQELTVLPIAIFQ